jgi:hypothetical protein
VEECVACGHDKFTPAELKNIEKLASINRVGTQPAHGNRPPLTEKNASTYVPPAQVHEPHTPENSFGQNPGAAHSADPHDRFSSTGKPLSKWSWPWWKELAGRHVLAVAGIVVTIVLGIAGVLPLAYHYGRRAVFDPPVIRKIEPDRTEVVKGESVRVTTYYDAKAGVSRVELGSTEGLITGQAPTFVLSTAGITRAAPFPIYLNLTVFDSFGRRTHFDYPNPISVIEKRYPRPIIRAIRPDSNQVRAGAPVTLTAVAEDPDGNPLHYEWDCTGGHLEGGDSYSNTLNTAGVDALSAPAFVSVGLTVTNGHERSETRTVFVSIVPQPRRRRAPLTLTVTVTNSNSSSSVAPHAPSTEPLRANSSPAPP